MAGLFVQIPIFAALFSVLGQIWELSGQHFFWISDLSRPDRLFDWGINIPYFGSYFNLLPVIMAALTIFSTWLAARHSGNEDSPTITLFGMGVVFLSCFIHFLQRWFYIGCRQIFSN
jgi:membrane protein insertase Oxa1/YidC/SpoIIIJ